MNCIYCRHKKAWRKYNSEWGVDEIIGQKFGDVVEMLYLCRG